MTFYERFETLLKKKNITIADLSRYTGIPYTTLDSIIKKKQNSVSVINASKIAAYFGVTVEWLATGKEYDRDNREVSPMARKLIEQIGELDDKEVKAVLDFLRIIRYIK